MLRVPNNETQDCMETVVYKNQMRTWSYLPKDTEDYRFPEFDAVLIGVYKSPFWRRLTPEGCKLHLQNCVKLKSVISTNADEI